MTATTRSTRSSAPRPARWLAALACVWLLGAPGAARARAAGGNEPQLKEAREHYDKGIAYYNLGEFDAAVGEFKLSYELSKAPRLLFNLAQAYRLKKDFEQALHLYNAYLRQEPDAPNRADVQARVEEMRRLVHDRERQRAALASTSPGATAPGGLGPRAGGNEPPGTNAPGTNAPATTAPANAPGASAPPPTPPTPPAAVSPPPSPSPAELAAARRLRNGGIATLVGGAVAVGVSGFFLAQSASDADTLQRLATDRGAWSADQAALYREGQRSQIIGGVLVGVGGAALVGGAVMTAIGQQRLRHLELAITPAPSGAHVALGGRF